MPTSITASEFLAYIVKNLVTKPSEVVVTEKEDEKGKLLTLRVAKVDAGIVIGKEGKTAKSLRNIIRTFAANTDSKAGIGLKIQEPVSE